MNRLEMLGIIGFWIILFALGGLVTFAFLFYMDEAFGFPYVYLEQPNFYEYQYDRYLYERMIYPTWMPTYTPYWLYEVDVCYCDYNDFDNQIAEIQLDDIYTPTERDAEFLVSGTSSYYNSIWSTYYGYD